MKIFENGHYRDATEEELAIWRNLPSPESKDRELSADEAVAILLGGAL